MATGIMRDLNHIMALFLLMVCSAVSAQRSLTIGSGIQGDSIAKVVTEDLLHIGGGSMQVSGRVISVGKDSIEDHGFMVDKSPTFKNPMMINMGPKSTPGFFVGKASGLSNNSQYYVKSFVKSNGKLIFGESLPFKTAKPFINDFFPKVGIPGETLSITGGNFPQNTKVFVGDQPAEVQEILLETVIKVVLPEISDTPIGKVKVVVDDEELVFDAPFNYRADKWEEIDNGKEFRIVGKVQDFDNGEPIPGVNIIYGESGEGLVSDIQGLFALFLKKGDYVLKVSFIGYLSQEIPITVQGNGNFRILLIEESVQLEEVVVKAKKADANVKSTDLGKNTLSMETIEALPPFVGEVDVLKSITLLPGVSTIGEASSGFNVRGGGGDQNLILLGGATLYNPSHLFGFFSSFNSDIVSSVTLYKGGIPANYGGRASSILDLSLKTGNLNKWNGTASIGLISAKTVVDGPIIKNKLSLLVGGRTSYSDWMLKAINNDEVSNSGAKFYDVNGILSYQLNSKNDFSYSFYRSLDDFKFLSDTVFSWTNQSHVLKWNHEFSPKILLNASYARTDYDFTIKNERSVDNFKIESGIADQSIGLQINYKFSENSEAKVGTQIKELHIHPGDLTPLSASSAITPLLIQNEKAREMGVYFQHDFDIIPNLRLSYGLRFNRFQYLGANTINMYNEDLPRITDNVIDQITFGKNDVIKEYNGLEPRLGLRWSINEGTSLKIGFNRMNQYIHLIANSAAIAPTDIWKLSDNFVKPQIATQYSVGFFKNFNNNSTETSVEIYYKDLGNVLEYKDGAKLIMNENLETELLSGEGTAFGIELYAKKTIGRLSGWASYTYSRSLRTIQGAYPEERINNGEEYPSNFDKPHDLTAVMEFNVNRNVKFSSIFTYSTGRAATFPAAKFEYADQTLAFFNTRNESRAPDYHRVDVSLTFKFESTKKLLQGDWVLSIYNLYGRKNAFSVFFDDSEGPPSPFKLSVIGIPFPALSYSFKF